jgi:predicted DNA-binding transcriptional regulator YafY
MRGDRLARQWRIIHLLLQRRLGMSAAEMAAELNYSVRNIYRDLDTLQKAGFPLYTERDGRKVRWTFIEGFRHATSIPFTSDELMAFEVAGELIRPIEGTLFADSLEHGLAKIRASLPEQIFEYLKRCRENFCAAEGPTHNYGEHSAGIKLLNEAINTKKSVQFFYTAFSTKKRSLRKVDPYGLYFHESTLYLIAHCHRRKELRNFAIDRIQAPVITEAGFEKPGSFNLHAYMAGAFGAFRGKAARIVLKFDADAARYIRERVWHASQVLNDEPDGGCVLELKVPVADEIVRWILSWAPGCEVLEPANLRERVVDAQRGSIDLHERVGIGTRQRAKARKLAAKARGREHTGPLK